MNNLYRMVIFIMSCLVLIESREDIYNCLVLREISCKVKRSHDYMTQIYYIITSSKVMFFQNNPSL